MPRYKPCDRSPKFLPVVLEEQIQPRTFEFTLDYLVDFELDLSALDAKFANDQTGASAYDPRVMLKIVLLGYARGLISSRAIERACRHNVQFMALSGNSAPSYTQAATPGRANTRPNPIRSMTSADQSRSTCAIRRKISATIQGPTRACALPGNRSTAAVRIARQTVTGTTRSRVRRRFVYRARCGRSA